MFYISSVTQSCPTLCDPHGLQHTGLPCPSPANQVGDAIPPSYPMLSPSTPTFNLSQLQGLFQ